jgi:hypothetical protein
VVLPSGSALDCSGRLTVGRRVAIHPLDDDRLVAAIVVPVAPAVSNVEVRGKYQCRDDDERSEIEESKGKETEQLVHWSRAASLLLSQVQTGHLALEEGQSQHGLYYHHRISNYPAARRQPSRDKTLQVIYVKQRIALIFYLLYSISMFTGSQGNRNRGSREGQPS